MTRAKSKLFSTAWACALILAGIAGCEKKQETAQQQSPQTPAQPAASSNQSPIADTSSPLYGWLKYASPDHKFTIILPDVPEQRQKADQTVQGEIQVHVYASEDEAHNGYSVAVYDFPPIHDDPKIFLARLEEIIIKDQDAKVTSYKPMQIGNYYGTEFEFVAGGQANYSGKCRLILVGQRAYALMVVYLTAGPKPTDADDFFDSLSLLQN